MDVRTLQLAAEVAALGGFSEVARTHGIEPSSVSRAIGVLEAEVGVRLFQRSTRRVVLTEAGAAYLGRVAPLLNAVEEAGEDARALGGSPRGTLRLTTSVAFAQACVVPLLPAFHARYPHLALDLIAGDANLDLVAERIDLAIRLAPSVDEAVVGAKLIDTHYRVCAAPDYLARAAPLVTPSDLAHHRCLRFDLPDYRTRWLFRDAAGNEERVPIDGDIATTNALVLRECARLALGPALLPDWLVNDDLTSGRLIDCLPDRTAAAKSFDTAAWLLYPTRSYLPAKVRVTIDFLRAHLALTN